MPSPGKPFQGTLYRKKNIYNTSTIRAISNIDKNKLKYKQIRTFNLDCKNLEDLNIIIIGKDIVYINIYFFEKQILEFFYNFYSINCNCKLTLLFPTFFKKPVFRY